MCVLHTVLSACVRDLAVYEFPFHVHMQVCLYFTVGAGHEI